jgi:hypothetical protein
MKNARCGARQRRRFRVSLGHTSSFTLDVCAGGFSTELMRVLAPGSPVQGSIQMNGTNVAFAGEVVWAKPGDMCLNLRGRMGVRFTRVSHDFPLEKRVG